MDATQRNELLEQLTTGISDLTDSEQWRRHLDVQGRFHRYSFGNVVLIAAQCPDASRVAGFRAWKKLGRSVRKGEKAIWILAPMVAREAEDSDGESGEHRGTVRAFRYVAVFDISQTDGEELPGVCRRLLGDEPAQCFGRLTEVAGSVGYAVDVTELPDGVNGDCAFTRRRIRVEGRNSPAQRVKTLVHELAHALLHEGLGDRALAELEAESTSYVVCRVLGLDSGAYSFGYVASWAGGGDQAVAGIRASCGRIQQAAAVILGSFESEEESDAA